MSQATEEPGLEVYFSSLSSQLSWPQDLLVAYFHWVFVQNGLKCIGKGEDFVANVRASELMPIGWNANENEYALKYVSTSGEQYLLKVIVADNTAFVALQHAAGAQESAQAQLDLDRLLAVVGRLDTEETRRRAIETLLDDSDLRQSLRAEISELTRLASESSVRPSAANSQKVVSTSARSDSGANSSGFFASSVPPTRPVVSPFNYGRADLDPLAVHPDGFGSGMLFDPLRSNSARRPRLPGHVPGARYDPFAPDLGSFDPDPYSFGRRSQFSKPSFGGFEHKPGFDDFA